MNADNRIRGGIPSFAPSLSAALLLLVFGVLLPACGDDDCPEDGMGQLDVQDDFGADTTPGSDVTDDTDDSSGDAGEDTDDVAVSECTSDAQCEQLLAPLGVCESATCTDGTCVRGTLSDGTDCDDEDACTATSACDKGVCEGPAIDCDDANPCTVDTCNTGTGCAHTFEAGLPCDDGNDCTANDQCVAGGCLGGANSCPEDCDNDLDDNGDGNTDCDDPKCAIDPVCNPECQVIDTLTCGTSLTVDLSAATGTSLVDTWVCSASEYPGVERGWQVVAGLNQAVTVTATGIPDGGALLHLSDPASQGCLPGLCVGSATLSAGDGNFGFQMGASDTHYAVLDLPEDATSGSVQLDVTCEACQPVCSGKQCGADGCGGSCGSCAGGASCVSGLCVSPPENDTCAGAKNIDPALLPVIVPGSTAGAADHSVIQPGSGCPGSNNVGFGAGAPDVVYRFVPAESGEYVISVDASFDTALYITTDCSDPQGSCTAAQNVAASGESIVVELSLGVPYFIIVDGFAGATAGSFLLSLAANPCTAQCAGKSCGPDTCGGSCGTCSGLQQCSLEGACAAPAPNDTCGTATVISGLPWSTTQSTGNAADDYYTFPEVCPGGPSAGLAGEGAGDLVYTFTSEAGGLYRATLTPSGNFDAMLTVLRGCPASTKNCAGASASGDPSESVDVIVSAGETIWLVVDGASAGQTGDFDLAFEELNCTPQCAGKTCGDDSCGGVCGTCTDSQSCSTSGTCVDVPANDTCAAPVVIDSIQAGSPWVYGGTTTGANNDYSVPPTTCTPGPDAAEYGKGRDVVFQYTAPTARSVKFSFDIGTNFVSYVYVMDTCGVPSDGCAAGTVTGIPGESELTVSLGANETIWVFVDGFGTNDSGNFVLQGELVL